MTKPIIRIYTDNEDYIDREMNAAEFVKYQEDQAAEEARQAEVEAKAKAKAELLGRLGITQDEAKLLLS